MRQQPGSGGIEPQGPFAAVRTRLAVSDAEAAKNFELFRSSDPLPNIPPALLNSADITDYVVQTGMIHPFDPAKLKPASYAFPLLGKVVYWETGVRRKRHVIKIGHGESFELQENSIAFVTLEPMLRVPDYIALRFDLRIKNVYRGLLLGTGPIVDPGFVGQLSLPLHNLTTNSYRFRGGEDLIWMVFTKISPNSPKLIRVGSYVPPRPDRLHAGSDVETYLDEAVGSGQVVSSISESLRQARSAQSWSRAISIVTAVAALALVAGVLALIINIYMFRTDAPSRSELDQTHHQVAQLKREIGRLQQKTSLTTTQQSTP